MTSHDDSATPSGWTHTGRALEREFRFADFTEAFAFMTRVAHVCDELDHHPDWSNSWNIVRVSLTTHSRGSTVTEKDVELAHRVNEIFDSLL